MNRLIRISFGPFQLGDLEEGSVQEVNGRTLRDQLGERLIEESGANFEAPIYNDFSNQPVQGDYARSDSRVSSEPERPQHRRQGDWVGGHENPIVKHQPRKTKEKPTDTENAVSKRPNRSANVWRAQGAKPMGPEKLSEPVGRYGGRGASRPGEPDRSTTRSANFRNASATGQRDGSSGEKREYKPREGNDERPKREYTPRSDKPYGERTSSFGGEKREYKPREGGTGEDRPKRAYTPRPAGDRPLSDRPKRYEGASASGEKREYKPREGNDERPKRDYAPRGDKPFGDRPARPAGERSFSDRPKRYEGSNPAPRDDSSAGERKPWEGASSKDRQNKTFGKRDDDRPKREGPKRFEGGKPFGAKPYAGKPSGGRPSGGRPSGGKPFGGKPRGKD